MSPTSYRAALPRDNQKSLGKDKKYKESGWGTRIRTSECLDQNQVPYRLAIPQQLIKKGEFYISLVFLSILLIQFALKI